MLLDEANDTANRRVQWEKDQTKSVWTTEEVWLECHANKICARLELHFVQQNDIGLGSTVNG